MQAQQFKIVLSGDSGVGKTSLILRFVEKQFAENSTATLDGEFKEAVVEVDGTPVKLQIWDTAGQERYRIITSSFYKNADGSMVVYDVTKKETFDNFPRWMQEVDRVCENVAKLVVGNKNDLGVSPKIEGAEDLALDQGANHIFTSAKTGEGVEEAFMMMVRDMVAMKANEQKNLNPHPLPEDGGGKTGCCVMF